MLEKREKAIAAHVAGWSAGLQPRGIRRLGEFRSATIQGPMILHSGDTEVYCVALTEYFETPDAVFPEKFEIKYATHIMVGRQSNRIRISRVNMCGDKIGPPRPLPEIVVFRNLQQQRRDQLAALKAAQKARPQ